jgi:NAD(P)-dependent dehydrogenase (short-subunit alcohol dehydrogenase family)
VTKAAGVNEAEQKTGVSDMPSILITGSNRGLGLEWVRQSASDGWRVFATCRHPAEADDLQALARQHSSVSIHRLDVTVSEDVHALCWELEGEPIDVLMSNAGIYLDKERAEFGAVCYHDWMRTFEVNTMGSFRICECLAENVALSRKRLIVAVSSHMGSIADIQNPGSYYYRSSKAALNAVMQGLAAELAPRGIGVIILHPGGVKTRMGPADGISPEESVQGMRRIVDRFELARDNGQFLSFDGSAMPW